MHLVTHTRKQNADTLFFGWHPLSDDWREGISGLIPEIVRMAEAARQCLIENQRDEQQLVSILQCMEAFPRRKLLAAKSTFPKLMQEQGLDGYLNISELVSFLLKREEQGILERREFVAVELLREISGLSELLLVAGKNVLLVNIQCMVSRIVKLYAAMKLVEIADKMPYIQSLVNEMASCLFKNEGAQA